MSLVRPSIALSKLDIEVLVFIRLFQGSLQGSEICAFFQDRILCAGGDALATAVFLVAVETKRKGNADLVDNFAELFGWRVAGETFGTQ